MSTSIKAELPENEENSCLACLANCESSQKEIPSIYWTLLNKDTTEIDPNLIRFCDNCLKFLQKAVKFREKCLETFDYLTKSCTKVYGSDLKTEEPIFIHQPEVSFPVQAIIDEVHDDPIKFPENEEMEDEKQVYQCEICFEIFMDRKKYRSHMKRERMKTNDVLLYCDICGYSTKRKPSLINHMQNKHLPKVSKKTKNEEEVTCIDCGKVCPSMSKYKTHQRIYHSVKTHTCNQCGISYTYGSDLQRHIERKHEIHYKDCPICGKQYKAISLTGHIASVHLQRRNFACDQCEQKFKSSSQLKKHKYSHGKLRPFMCKDCGIGYYMNELLRKHYEKIHNIIYSQEEIRKLCGKGAGIGGAPLKYTGNGS